jgi:hypothetical protein
MNIIFETKFGSHLYGTATPNSDIDFKGIILPTKEEILLGKSNYHVDQSSNKSSTKNTSNDIDRTYYTLSYFISLACKGETVALDMLHGEPNNWTISNPIWGFIRVNRYRFYTKSMKSYIGYVRKQASKYGIKGSRIHEIENMIDYLNTLSPEIVIGECSFNNFTYGDWIEYKGNKFYEFLGNKFQDTLKVKFMLNNMKTLYKQYGERSKLAKTNEGVDWKAIHHALRAGYQAREIYLNNGFSYPLKETAFLLKVKKGELDFVSQVSPELESIVNEVVDLAEKSTLPENVNYDFWNDFLVNQHWKVCCEKY